MQFTVVDIGHKLTKLLSVETKKKTAMVSGCCKIESSLNDEIDVSSISDMIDKIYECVLKNGFSNNIVLSLPNNLGFSEVVDISKTQGKNINIKAEKEMKIRNIQTHIMDWTYINDNAIYISALPKNIISTVMQTAKKHKLSIIRITTNIQNLIDISHLYDNDYTHINKLYVDFGADSMKIIVQNENKVVEVAEIGVGYSMIVDSLVRYFYINENDALQILQGSKSAESYDIRQPEIDEIISDTIDNIRIEIGKLVEKYNNLKMPITKIIQMNNFVDKSLYDMIYHGVEIETISFNDSVIIKNSSISFSDEITQAYNCCMGGVIGMILPNQHINLILQEEKNAILNKKLQKMICVACGTVMAVTLLSYGYVKFESYRIHKLEKKNDEYIQMQSEITSLKTDISEYNEILMGLKSEYFPFVRFFSDISTLKPSDAYILSIDSEEQLENLTVSKEVGDDTIIDASEVKEPTATEKPPERPKYKKDLLGRKLVMRIYSNSQGSISEWVYGISQLSYIKTVDLIGIEEHELNTNKVNICELSISL